MEEGCRAHVLGNPSAKVLDGRKAADAWNLELKKAAQGVSLKIGRPPALSVVLVGTRSDSLLYVEKKEEACSQARLFNPSMQFGQ